MDLKGKGRGKTIIHPMITDCYNVIMTAENGQLVKDMVIEQRYGKRRRE